MRDCKLRLSMATIGIMLVANASADMTEEERMAQAASDAQFENAIIYASRNRGQVIDEVKNAWASSLENDAGQFAANLQLATAKQLARMSSAGSADEAEAILLRTESLAERGGSLGITSPANLGDSDQDLTLTPVSPCRIVDTRFATVDPGPLLENTIREFFVYGDVSGQNGGPGASNPTTCTSPRGEPAAVAINITAVPFADNGNLRAYPANEVTPNTSIINFKAGTNIANAATVRTWYNLGTARDIEIYAFKQSHVIIDVLGYYYPTPAIYDIDYRAGAVSDIPLTIPSQWMHYETVDSDGTATALWTSNVALGTTLATAGRLDLYPCYQLVSDVGVGPPTTVGAGLFNITATTGRSLYGISATRLLPTAATYRVGICGNQFGNSEDEWDNNEWGYTSAIVVKN